MKRFLLIPSIILSLIITSFVPVVALEQNEVHYLSEEEVLILKQEAYEKMVAKYEGNSNARSSSSYEYRYDPVETITTGLSEFKDADGQPRDGVEFNTTGSGIFWKNSTYSPGSFQLSLGFTYGPATVTIGYQPGTVSQTQTAYIAAIEQQHVNKFVKLKVARKFDITHYKIYRKIRTESTWTYISDSYPAVATAHSFKIYIVSDD